MADIVFCNDKQAQVILKKYFKRKPIVISVCKDSEDEEYYIRVLSVPSGVSSDWVYRTWNSNDTNVPLKASSGSVFKGGRRYDLYDTYTFPQELTKPLNEACERAIKRYEDGCDLFLNEPSGIIEILFRNPIVIGIIIGIILWFIWH